jgi:thiamine biosynthesis protein ThiI
MVETVEPKPDETQVGASKLPAAHGKDWTECVLIRLAPEINIKSRRVKSWLVDMLQRNIEKRLREAGFRFHMERRWSRFIVHHHDKQLVDELSRVFGIGSLSPVEARCAPTLEAMTQTVQPYRAKVAGKTFCIRAKRSGAKGFTSHDLERQLGAELAPAALKVSLKHPEVKIEVEVNAERAYFFSTRIAGPGGFPLGSQGRALCLFSGGFDSAVAAWYMMKRGVELDFVVINFAGQSYLNSVRRVADKLIGDWAQGSRSKLWVVEGQQLGDVLRAHVKGRYVQIILKRIMLRVGNLLADRMPGVQALVTGDSIGQVSSQTFKNLTVINRVSKRLVLRPLICFDKEDIIQQSRAIGLYEVSEKVKEFCSLATAHPATSAPRSLVEAQEEKLPRDLLPQLVASVWCCDQSQSNESQTEGWRITYLPAAAMVLDCRSRQDFEAWHHPDAVHMEPQLLMRAMDSLPAEQTYVLYCEYGIETSYLAEQMKRQKGIRAYSFVGGAKALRKWYETHLQPTHD